MIKITKLIHKHNYTFIQSLQTANSCEAGQMLKQICQPKTFRLGLQTAFQSHLLEILSTCYVGQTTLTAENP